MNLNRIVFVALLAACLVLAACDRQAAAPESVRPAIVQTVAPVAASQAASYTGEVHARYESELGFRVAGKLVERRVDPGDRVEAGQLLARLDPGDLKLAAQAAQAELAAARNQQAQAERQYQRAAKLFQRGLVSEAARDQRKTQLEVATARLQRARKQQAVQQNQLGYTTLHTDHAGVITAVHAGPGQVLAAGQPVFGFARAGERELWVAVPESRVDTVTRGEAVEVGFWALPGVRVPGKVRQIAANGDPASGTYRVRITLLQQPHGLRLGMAGTAYFQDAGDSMVIRLPMTSLYHVSDQPAVWVVDPASHEVALQPVTVLRFENDAVVLAAGEGLETGRQVVTRGVSQLHSGQRVEPIADYFGPHDAGAGSR